MNCFNHIEQIAIAQCTDCSKGLCNVCSQTYTIPICQTCNSKRSTSEKWSILKELLTIYIGGAIIMFVFIQFTLNTGKSPKSDIPIKWSGYFMMFYQFAAVIAGWKTLNKITPRMFMFLPIIGWLIYFVIKFVLSSLVGLVMLPIRTIRCILRLVELNKIDNIGKVD